MDNFKILSIDQTTGNIEVQFSFEDEPRVLSSLPLNDKVELLSRLNDIGISLKKEVESKIPTIEVSSLVGKSQDIKKEVREIV